VRIQDGTDRTCGVDLAQSPGNVAMSLEHSFEGFPGAPRDGIRITKALPIRQVGGCAWIYLSYRFPIAEVPGFEFFDRHPVDELPVGAGCRTSGAQSGVYSYGFELPLEDKTVVVVTIDHHHEAPFGR